MNADLNTLPPLGDAKSKIDAFTDKLNAGQMSSHGALAFAWTKE